VAIYFIQEDVLIMKFSRFVLSALLVAGLAVSVTMAQQAGRGQGHAGTGAQAGQGGQGGWQNHQANPDEQLKHLAKALSLSDAQQVQLKPILADRVEQMKALRADTTGDHKAIHGKMKTIQEDFESKLQAILTDDQKQKYADFKEQQKEKMQEHRQQHQNAPAPTQVPPPTAAPAPPSGL
jgi:uncharacterized protein YdeI (BOF family)